MLMGGNWTTTGRMLRRRPPSKDRPWGKVMVWGLGLGFLTMYFRFIDSLPGVVLLLDG
jgi:hypothetical protein